MSWEIVIGLEIHAQLSTASKIFSGAATAFGAAPNSQASLVDLGYPGTLPVLNAGAVSARSSSASRRAARSRAARVFARKNYFYPDLPKGYQISQYELAGRSHGRPSRSSSGTARRRRSASRARTSRRTRASRCTRTLHGMSRHRPEPRGHAAARDRLRARSALGRRGRHVRARRSTRSCATSTFATATCRKARSAATRTCRCAAKARRARHPLRDQEPELVSASWRKRSSSRSSGRSSSSRPAARSCRRRGSTIPIATRLGRCAARKKRTTTATSLIPISCRS